MADPETRSKALREWITGLLLPLAIFVYTYQKDQSDEKSRELDRVTTIIKSLGSTSSLERSYARSYIEYLYRNHQAPAVVNDLLAINVSAAPTSAESKAALRTLETVQSSAQAPDQAAVVKSLPSRLYIQVTSAADRATAVQLQGLLSGNGLSVPGIEVVATGPSLSEVRYFHQEDRSRAEGIAKKMTQLGIPTVAKDTQALAKLINASVPMGQMELWLASNATLKQPL